MDDVRETLDRLIRENGDDYSGLSKMLGRNAAYIQQFIKRGTPRKLDPEDRLRLASFYGIDEQLLGGPPPTGNDGMVRRIWAYARFLTNKDVPRSCRRVKFKRSMVFMTFRLNFYFKLFKLKSIVTTRPA